MFLLRQRNDPSGAAIKQILYMSCSMCFLSRKRRIELLGKVERLADTFDLSGQERSTQTTQTMH